MFVFCFCCVFYGQQHLRQTDQVLEEAYRLCVCVCVCVCLIVCDLETSTVRRSRPTRGCYGTEKNTPELGQCFVGILNTCLLLITALQLLVQSFGHFFLLSSSILDKGLPIWHF